MSASSGITVSQDLASAFAEAVQQQSIRLIKVVINHESLVHEASIPSTDSFQDDFAKLLDDDFISPDSPAYVLVKLTTSQDWLFISYVPENSKVRDKMLYASTRASFLRSLGSGQFTDTIYATSKDDLTWDAYLAHLKHNAAPNPLSTREQELSDLRAAEAGSATYEGSRARVNHIGSGIGLSWSPDVEVAVHELTHGTGESALIVTIDPQTETIILHSQNQLDDATSLAKLVPKSDPCYVLLAKDHQSESGATRQIVFIYSCPSTSPVKNRMLYSSASGTTYHSLKTSLAEESSIALAPKRIETSDPTELTKEFLETELNYTSSAPPAPVQQKAFARPKGPPRRR